MSNSYSQRSLYSLHKSTMPKTDATLPPRFVQNASFCYMLFIHACVTATNHPRCTYTHTYCQPGLTHRMCSARWLPRKPRPKSHWSQSSNPERSFCFMLKAQAFVCVCAYYGVCCRYAAKEMFGTFGCATYVVHHVYIICILYARVMCIQRQVHWTWTQKHIPAQCAAHALRVSGTARPPVAHICKGKRETWAQLAVTAALCCVANNIKLIYFIWLIVYD